MLFRASIPALIPGLVLVPLAMFAQNPPAKVDQALRARVKQFYQYHVDAEFEKAWPMVCEDTQKEYFSRQKAKYESFAINSIKYSDKFSKAEVTLTVQEKRRVRLEFPETVVTMPSTTYWKVEAGKWCWYENHNITWLTPMGPSDVDGMRKAQAKGQTPDINPGMIARQAKIILEESSKFDKSNLTLDTARASTDQAVFRNGQGGSIKVELAKDTLPAGLSAKLDKTDLNPGETATLTVSYAPPQKETASEKDETPKDVTIRVVMEPFSRIYPITVHFAAAQRQ